MVTVIKKDSGKKVASLQLDKALKTKGEDTHKYCSIIKLNEDALAVQKRMRDE
jgi:hypothetical protein